MSDDLRTAAWKEKTDFVPGMGPDTLIPELRFQVLHGRVYSLQVWPNGSTARGTMTLDELEKQIGKPVVKEGWYDHEGEYLGTEDPDIE